MRSLGVDWTDDAWRNEACEACGGNRATRLWRGEHLCEECFAQRDEALKKRRQAWIERYEKPSARRARLRREQRQRENAKNPLAKKPPAKNDGSPLTQKGSKQKTPVSSEGEN